MFKFNNTTSLLFLLLVLSICPAYVLSATSITINPSIDIDEEISVIVTFTGKVNLGDFRQKTTRRHQITAAFKQRAKSSQKHALRFLAKQKVSRVRQLWIINALAITASPKVIDVLACMPGIRTIRPELTLRAPYLTYSDESQVEWNLSAINAPELWALGYSGQGVVVASLDTGVDIDHPDVGSRWRGGTNSWFDTIAGTDTPYDGDTAGYHGTKTMGIMVGGDFGGSAIGVAPDANWIAARIFDDNGIASESNVHSAFQWVLDPDSNDSTDDCPDIVNISWGFDEDPNECIEVFREDIQVLKEVGIAVVCAAGNSGELGAYSSVSPANYPESFAVGAVQQGQPYFLALWSSRGPSSCDWKIFPQVVAPGVNIKTADFIGYAWVEGTSFAASHVSGAVALMLSAMPFVSVLQIEWALTHSAVDLGPNGPDNGYGYGLIDVMAAYRLLRADTNPDAKIDLSDLAVLVNEWLRTDCNSEIPCYSDLNDDGEVNFHDYAEFASQYVLTGYP